MKTPNDIMTTVIEELEKSRKKQGLSHEAIARETKLHRSTISLIENEKRQPTLLTCLKIAQALDVDLGKLITKAQK